MFLYLIRHGEPDYETDTLTELGVKQAELLSRRFKHVKFDRIFTSPLGRAKQTAMPTCIMQNKKFEELQWLSESRAYDAMSAEIDGKKDWWFAVQNTKIRTPEDAEKYATSQTRVFYNSIASSFDILLSELGYEKCGRGTPDEASCGYEIKSDKYDRVALFCHDGISKILLSYALLIPFHVFCASFSIPHTGVTVLHYAQTDDKITAPRCMLLSDLSHLYAAREASPSDTRLYNFYNNAFDI